MSGYSYVCHVCAVPHIELHLASYMKAQEVSSVSSRRKGQGEGAEEERKEEKEEEANVLFPGLLPRGIKSPRGTCPMLIAGGEAVTA